MRKTTKQTFSLYWQHVKNYKLLGLVMIISITIGFVLEVIIPLYYKKFFDTLTITNSLSRADLASELIKIIVIILIINICSWTIFRAAVHANSRFQPKIMADLANTCFNYLQQHSHKFFINRFTGSLVRRVNRLVDSFEAIADRFYWDLFPTALKIVIILIVLTFTHPLFALIILIWAIVYIAISYGFALYKLKYDIQIAEHDSRVTGDLSDAISNNLNIKLFSALRKELFRFKRLTKKQQKLRTFNWDLNGYMEAFQHGIMVALEFLVFYFAIRLWLKGQITIGDFVLIQTYLLTIFMQLWDFSRIIRDIYRRLADAEEMTEILNTPYAVQDKPQAGELTVPAGQVVFKEVSFSYTKTRMVLKNFNLEIKPQEKVGIVGPSGAGKTTLANILLRLYDVQQGKILVDEQNIADVTQNSLRENISLVPQDPILFHRTLIENIRYGKPQATKAEIAKAAKAANCHDFINQLDQGYETYVGERGIKLSGGERQRVAIARAILKNAPILVLDEATSSLDSHSEMLIQDALEKLMTGKTTIVIAHRLSTLLKMDRIIVIDDQEIVETGTHKSLLKKPNGLYRKLWQLQAGGFIQ